MTLVAGLSTFRLYQMYDGIQQQTIAASQAGEVPEISIENGTTSVQGEDPFLLTSENGFFLGVDTRGKLPNSELDSINGGLLVTETELRTYNNGNYQAISLKDYNTGFNLEKIIIDGPALEQFFSLFSVYYTSIAALSLWIWDVVLWLLFLAMTAYFLWGPIGQVIQGFSFRAVLIIGIYAHLPAFVINYILKLFGVQIMFIYTVLLMVFWVGAIYLVLRELAVLAVDAEKAGKIDPTSPQPLPAPPTLWPAWLGLPLFIFVVLNAIFNWENAPLYILGGLAITITGLLTIDTSKANSINQSEK